MLLRANPRKKKRSIDATKVSLEGLHEKALAKLCCSYGLDDTGGKDLLMTRLAEYHHPPSGLAPYQFLVRQFSTTPRARPSEPSDLLQRVRKVHHRCYMYQCRFDAN